MPDVADPDPESVALPLAPDAVADMLDEMVDVLTRVGSCAPHGLRSRHALWHALLPPQRFTHCVLASVQR
jgi:hypothetical protein